MLLNYLVLRERTGDASQVDRCVLLTRHLFFPFVPLLFLDRNDCRVYTPDDTQLDSELGRERVRI